MLIDIVLILFLPVSSRTIFILLPHIGTLGGGQFDDDEGPDHPNTWLFNETVAMVIAKVIFILFANGLLHVCERIQNPLDGRKSSFCRLLNGIIHQNLLLIECFGFYI